MTNTTNIDLATETQMALGELYPDSSYGPTRYTEQQEPWMPSHVTDEDVLAEVPQAFAAYLDSKRHQWG